MNINLRPKKCSGQSRYGRYSSYATGHGCICDIITPLSYRLHTYSQVWLTDTGRLTPRPHSISLTYTSTVSHQVVASVTTVGCYLSQCCSIGMTNLAIRSGIQSSTVYNCGMKVYIYIFIIQLIFLNIIFLFPCSVISVLLHGCYYTRGS